MKSKKNQMKILSIGLVLCFVGVSIVVVSADQTVTVDSEEFLLFDVRTSVATDQVAPDYTITYLGDSAQNKGADTSALGDVILDPGIPVGMPFETFYPTCKSTCPSTCHKTCQETCPSTCKWTCEVDYCVYSAYHYPKETCGISCHSAPLMSC